MDEGETALFNLYVGWRKPRRENKIDIGWFIYQIDSLCRGIAPFSDPGSVELIRRFNRDVEIIPHLAKIPFDYHSLDYFIDLTDKQGRTITCKGDSKDIINGAHLMGDRIYFHFENEEKLGFQTAFFEDFEEALNKVKAEGYDVDIPLIFVDNPSESVEMR